MNCPYCKDSFNWIASEPLIVQPKVVQMRLQADQHMVATARVHQRRWWDINKENFVQCEE